MVDACAHNKYDELPELKPDYEAAIAYRRSRLRTMFPLAVAAVKELRGINTETDRLRAVHDGIICATGACALHGEVMQIVNDGSVDNYQPPVQRSAEESFQNPLTA